MSTTDYAPHVIPPRTDNRVLVRSMYWVPTHKMPRTRRRGPVADYGGIIFKELYARKRFIDRF